MRGRACARRILLVAILPLLGACTVGPDFVPPKEPLPAQFTEHAATPGEIARTNRELAQWWRSFDDPVLDRLIAEGVAGNVDLQVADQRLLEARAERDEVAAGAYPTVDFSTQAFRAYSSRTLEYPPGVGKYHDYILGFDASWELDVFGKNRRATEAAEDTVNATIESRRALMVSLLAEIASDYTTLRATQALLAIADNNVRIAQEIVTVEQREYAQGIGTDLETVQARSQLEATQATVPGLKAKIAVMAHAIAVLVGRDPGDLETSLEQPEPLMTIPAQMPVTVPAAVIANRPDVHEAELRYAAANAEIGVAIANRLPDFSIPISVMPQSSALNELFTSASLAFSYGLSSTTHLYAGGKLTAQVREARAAAQAARLTYKQTVLLALQNVEDALVRTEADRAANAALAASVHDAATALNQAQRLHQAGLTGFLTVLTDERTVFAARNALADNDLAMVQDYIALFKALGGGWQSPSG